MTASAVTVSHAYTVTLNLPTDGSVSVSPAGGEYEEGATVTFTATSASRKFVRWYGDVASNATITVTVNQDLALSPYFSPTGWAYDSATKTITDGYWIFNTTVSGDAMTISSRKTTPTVGFVDFSQPVEGGTYSIVTLENNLFKDLKTLTEVRLPTTLQRIGTAVFEQCSKLATITPFLPDSLTSIGTWAFAGCSSLTDDLSIQFKTFSFSGESQFTSTHITSVYLGPGVLSVPKSAFNTATTLTNVVLMGTQTLEQDCFGSSILENVYFATKPTWNNTTPFYPHPNYTRYFVKRDSEEWDAFVTDPTLMTPWENLSASEQAIYTNHYPDEPLPIGRTTSASYLSGGWILRWTVPTPMDRDLNDFGSTGV